MKRSTLFLNLPNVLVITITMCCLLAFTNAKYNLVQVLSEKFKIPIIKEEGKKADACLAPKYMMNAWYTIERIEPFCEELNIKKDSKGKKEYLEWSENPLLDSKESFSNADLVVIADTINEVSMTKKPIWASWLFHRSFNDNRKVLQDDTLIQDVKSFPIYIANNSPTKTANLETQDGSAMMVVQAQDEKQNWRDIEYWSGSWCGNSYYSLNIPPKHFAFTRGIKCSGDYYALCRLKVDNRQDSLFSNTFKMYISKTQFEKPKWEGE